MNLNHKTQALVLSTLLFLPFIMWACAYYFFKIQIQEETRLNLNTILSSQSALNSISQPALQKEQKEQKKPIKHLKPLNKQANSSNSTKAKEQASNTQDLNTASKNKPHIQNFIISQIQQAIEKEKSYPLAALKKRIQGSVEVEFTYSKNQISHLTITKSSGHKILDSHALQTIQRALPFFPYYENELKINIPIIYKLAKT